MRRWRSARRPAVPRRVAPSPSAGARNRRSRANRCGFPSGPPALQGVKTYAPKATRVAIPTRRSMAPAPAPERGQQGRRQRTRHEERPVRAERLLQVRQCRVGPERRRGRVVRDREPETIVVRHRRPGKRHEAEGDPEPRKRCTGVRGIAGIPVTTGQQRRDAQPEDGTHARARHEHRPDSERDQGRHRGQLRADGESGRGTCDRVAAEVRGTARRRQRMHQQRGRGEHQRQRGDVVLAGGRRDRGEQWCRAHSRDAGNRRGPVPESGAGAPRGEQCQREPSEIHQRREEVAAEQQDAVAAEQLVVPREVELLVLRGRVLDAEDAVFLNPTRRERSVVAQRVEVVHPVCESRRRVREPLRDHDGHQTERDGHHPARRSIGRDRRRCIAGRDSSVEPWRADADDHRDGRHREDDDPSAEEPERAGDLEDRQEQGEADDDFGQTPQRSGVPRQECCPHPARRRRPTPRWRRPAREHRTSTTRRSRA